MKELKRMKVLIFGIILFSFSFAFGEEMVSFQSPTNDPNTSKCDGKATSEFRCLERPEHEAIDIANSLGSPIYSATDGIVAKVGWQLPKGEGFGFRIYISTGNFTIIYGHLKEQTEEQGNIFVRAGDIIKKGDQIGEMGSTGYSTGPHLHFQINEDGTPLNPRDYIKECLPERAKAVADVPGNDHPDETYDIVGEVFPPFSGENKHFTVNNYVGVFNEGFSNSASEMVLRNWNAIGLVSMEDLVNGSIVEDLKYYPVMLIPTAGLYGLDNSSTFRQKLADYVYNGGILICFTQQHGYEFNALPGGEVSGYGWNEDQSCHTNAAYIDTYHPMFAGQDSANLDANVDGYFTNWPSEATILLKRTKNGMPAMIAYPYGDGWVVVGSLYSDWSYGHGGMTRDELNLVRDLISWAKNPDREIKEYKPGETVSITIPVTNYSNNPSNSAVLTLLAPNRDLVDTTEVVHSLNPGESTEIPFTYTASLPLGTWWVNYTLKDPSGNTIQYGTEGERFQVSYHYIGYKSSKITFSITSDSEKYVYGSDATFTFHIWNQGENARDITVWYSFPHNYWATGDPIYGSPGTTSPGHKSNLYQTINVPAHGEASFVYSIPVRASYDRLWADFYDEDDNFLGKASRGFYGIEPSVDTDVTVDKEIYRKGEEVGIIVELKNRQEASYDVTVKTVVKDPANFKVFEENHLVSIPSDGSTDGSTENRLSFILPSDAMEGNYTVQVEVSHHSEMFGFGSAFFEVASAFLRLSVKLPDVFIPNSINPLSFDIEYVGMDGAAEGQLTVRLYDPDKYIVWADTKGFTNLLPNSSTTVNFSLVLEQIKFGNYRLEYTLSYGSKIMNGVAEIPCDVAMRLGFDKTSYRVREELNADLELVNTGKFKQGLKVVAEIPDCEFSQTRNIELSPGDKRTLTYSLTIPSQTGGGSHDVNISLYLDNSTLSETYAFFIPSAKLELSLDKLDYSAGETGTLKVENTGGVDAGYDYTLKIIDRDNIPCWEKKGAPSTIEAGSSELISFTVPDQLVSGWYSLWMLLKDLQTGKQTSIEKYFEVSGLNVVLEVSTDKKVYFSSENITGMASLENLGQPLSGANLNIKAYSAGVGWTNYTNTNHIQCIAVDGNYVWFGTDGGGVKRYDKINGTWRSYTTADGLTSNWIYCIAADGDYVWFGDDGFGFGVGRYDKVSDIWKKYTTVDGLASNYIVSIAVDGNYVWFGTYYQGVSRYDKANDKWEHYTEVDGLVDDSINCIAVDGDYVWFGTRAGVSRYDKVNNTWQTFTVEDGLVDNDVSSIAVDGDFVWFGTWDGVGRYDKASNTWQNFTTVDGLAGNYISSIAVDRDCIWFGTWEGVSRYDKERGTWETFTTADGLLSNDVISVGIDGKYVWFGMWEGISRYEKNAAWQTFTATNELVDNFVNSVVADQDYIWFGTRNGVSSYDKINDNWQSYTADGLIHEWVYDIAVDGDYVWFGTYGGVSRYDKVTGKWNGYLEGYTIGSIAVDGNYVWFGTYYGYGAKRYDKVEGTWKTYTTADGLASNYVFSIVADGSYVWFGTRGGVSRYDKVDGAWKTYTTTDGLVNNTVTSIAIDGEYVWFGTGRGVSRYHKPSNTWRTFTTADGLASNRIKSIAIDRDYLWFGTEWEGVSRYNKVSDTWQTFTTNDGLADMWVTSVAVDGIYTWFGTRGGGASRYQKLGAVAWEKDIPVSGSGEINLTCDIGVINGVGKFYLEGVLTSSMGQEIARASNSFYLTTSAISLTFNTDKRVYEPGETVTITGEVINGGELAECGLRLVLRKRNGEQIYSDTFDLQPEEKRTFVATTTASDSFVLEGTIGNVKVSDYIRVESPDVEMVVVGPDVVGQEPFELSVLLDNTGEHDVDLSLDFAGEISTMTLTVGESRLFQRSFVVSQDTTFQINLSGDVEKSVTKVVKFGGEIILSLEPEEVYPEGTVEVPFTITNSGSVDMELDFAFTLMKGTVTWVDTESHPYYLPAWGGVFDSLIYENMDEGNYVLEYKGLVSGSGIIRVAKFNVVEIEELIVHSSQLINGKIPVEITVQNVGANDFVGSLRLDTGFYKEDKDLNLNIGETKVVTFDVSVGVACGGYEAIAQVFHNGNVIAEATESFVLMPVFSLVSVPSALSFDVGQQATVAMTIKNTGAVGGTAEASLSCGDIVDQTKTMWLATGEERELSFSFTVADDLWERDYIAMIELRNLESGLSQISEIPLHINGYNVSVSASLDKDLYTEGETAKLTLEITNGNPQFTPTIFTRVIFNSYTQMTMPFVLEMASSLEFDVPVHFSEQKISYGIYTESGRALYLNSIYVYEKGKVVSLLTDKQVYNMGEPINVTVMPETTGYFEISAPNCLTGLSLSTTEQFELSWNLPEQVVSGTYSINYSLEDTEGSHRFDVIGYSVRILEANLDKEKYLNGEEMGLRLRIDSNRDISVASFKGWVLSGGEKFDCFESTGPLKQGESNFEMEGEMLAIEKGVARLAYTISKPVDGGEELLLVSGAEGFDVVLPDETSPVSELHIYGPQYVDAITTHTYVSSRTTFTITAVDPEVDAFASGVANIYYRINVSTLTPSEWKVYTSSFSIFGEDGVYIIEYYSIDNMDNKEEIKLLAVTLDNSPPETVLISPSPDSEGVCKIFSGIFPVIGTADGEQFDGYELAFASGTVAPLNFITIKESTNPVTESELGLWDTTGLEQGYYTLKLSAWDKVENLGMFTVAVFVGEPEFLFAYTYSAKGRKRTSKFEPAYVTIDKENYSYVTSHKLAGMVVKFDSDGNVVDVFGRRGRGEKRWPVGAKGDWRGNVPLAIPEGIAVDTEGNMWVADRVHNRVVKMDPQGNLLLQIGGEGFGKWDGSHRRWSKRDEIDGHCEFTFNWPVGVALDGEGNVYVADRFNNRIQKFTAEGELVEDATIHTGIFDMDHRHWRDHWSWWKQKPFYRPGSIALDGERNIYVADQFHERVLKFSPQGELIMVIGTDENDGCQWKHHDSWFRHKWKEGVTGGSGPGQFHNPDGIIVTQEGYIYITDQGNNRIQKFDKYGNFLVEWGRGKERRKGHRKREIPGGEFDNPGGIAFGSDGNVHVVDRGNGRVQVFGLPTEVATQDVVRSLSRVAADVSGPDPTFKLGEVYSFPNPAKRGKSPTIHFESGIADRVEINIYDIAGELIHSSEITDKPEIINDKYAYEYGWNISNIASGVYIYLIRARKLGEKEIKVVKKLAIVK